MCSVENNRPSKFLIAFPFVLFSKLQIKLKSLLGGRKLMFVKLRLSLSHDGYDTTRSSNQQVSDDREETPNMLEVTKLLLI